MFSIPADNFKILFEQLPGLFLILTPDFTIAAVSDLYIEASLTTRECIIGRNIFQVFPDNPDDKKANGVSNLKASLHYVLEHKVPHAMADQQYDIRRADGLFEERHWSPLNTPVFNEQHEICYIIHKVQDVTASRHASNQLKKNKRDFQLLVNSVKDYAIFMLDKKGCVNSWNSGAEHIKGYTATEIMGSPLDIFYTDTDIANGIPQKNLQMALQSGHFETEGWRKRVDGSLFYANIVYTALIDSNGKHYGYAKVTKDITEKRKDEDRIRFLASITNSIQDPVISSDNNFCITRWNDAAEKLFGWKSEEVIGKTTVDVLKTIYPCESRQEVIATIAKKGIWQGELVYHTKSGNPVNVVATASKLKDAEGDQYGNLILVRDITIRKKTEEALNYLNQELEFEVAERTMAIKRSEKQYRYLFENNPMPMWVMHLETFKILDVNEMAVLQYGYSREEFLSMTALDIRPDADKNSFIHSDHADEITAGNYNKGIWNHKKKNGTIIQVEIIVHDIIFHGAAARIILANDITERIGAEEKLMASEKLYRALIENGNDIITLMDETFQLIYRSPAASRITGWTNEDMLGIDATRNIFEEDRPMAAAIVQDVMANPGKTIPCKFRMWHKQGHYIWVEGILTNLLKDKYVNAIVFNFRNVTKRIEAEEKLTASEKRFRALIENNEDLIVLLDETFKVVYRSPSAARITGWTDDEITGFSSAKNMHPDDVEEAVALLNRVKANPGKPVYGKFRNRHRNGHYQWMEGVAINLLHDDNVKAIVFNSRDISARVESEEKLIASEKQFRYTLDNMLEGIQIIGFDWRYIYVNDAMAKHAKYPKAAFTGCTVMEKFPGIEHTEIFKVYQKCFTERIPIHLENEFEFPDKTKSWFELSFQPVPEGIFILSVDITDRKKAEQKIIESEENLKAIFDNAAEGFILTDINGIVKAFNYRVFNSILVNVQEEIKMGSSIFDYITASRKEFFYAVFLKVTKGETIQYDRCYESENNTVTWINFIFSPVKDNNIIKGVCITGRDITIEKIAQQQKEFDHSNLNAMINNTGDMVWSVDREFNLITSNNAFNDMIETVTGQKITKGFKMLNEEFPEDTIKRYKTYYERAFAGSTFKEIEYNNTPHDFWTEISFNPIYEGNAVIGTACFSRDITERIIAEEQLRKSFADKQLLAQRMSVILNTLPANIALLNEEGIIVDVNDAWRIFADENQFIGSNHGIGNNYITIAENASGNEKVDGKKVADGITAVLTKEIEEFVYEYPCHSPQKERWFRMVVSPLQEKEYAGAVVMHVDISELRMLEQARLKSSMDEQKKITLAILQGQEKERNYIGKELHDNINQILAGTKLFLTSAGHKNATVKELIQYPVELLNSAIEEIRSLCRNLVSPIKNIDLENLAQGLLINLNHSTIIKTDLIYSVPKPLLTDDLKLNIYRILQELVNNTLKYAEAKCITISIKAARNKVLTVIVADDGKGFDVNSKRNGIGISNIMNRVESFDGNLEIESNPGKGCRTTIAIPC
ncbi:sensor histidine kinase [Ferruginibacter profundus]